MTESRTTGALLDAAEAAFAERGVDDVSLRAIMRSAGANPAAVHYHYGSREALVGAVLERVLAPLQARRLELLAELEDSADARLPSVRDLLAALVRPDLEMVLRIGERNPSGVRLMGAIYTRPSDFVKPLVEASFAPVAARFMPLLLEALPELDPAELSWRVRWGVFGVLGAILSDGESAITAESLEEQLARILAATVGALTAPPTKEFSK